MSNAAPIPHPLPAVERVMVALDVFPAGRALDLAEQLAGRIHWFKVGSRLFVSQGPPVVRGLLARGASVFLDLKFHDIPDQVGESCRAAADQGVRMVTVHALGGPRMIAAARRALDDTGARVSLLAVTVLTSHAESDLPALGMPRPLATQVRTLAELAAAAGADGVVCSPLELGTLRTRFPPPFALVTPGIRGAGDTPADQRRTLSAGEAVALGADRIVVGRPIVGAPDPVAAADRILAEVRTSLGEGTA